MEKKLKIRVTVSICITILIGFLAVGITNYIAYSKIIKDDILNISKLTTTNIYSNISNELTKPVFVSLTMANDSFVKSWLADEKAGDQSSEHLMKLQQYLQGIKDKYNYNSVFLVSEYSKNYYHFNGINKVISPDNTHDQWYYSYIKSNQTYVLDVDTDEANQNRLSVFVNCRIEDEDENGNLLGVTGVGVELNQIQELLKTFEDNFHLQAMLFDNSGTVQVNTDTQQIGIANVFHDNSLKKHRKEILQNYYNLGVYKFENSSSQGYMITRYIDDMDWYLLIKKDTSILRKSLEGLIIKEFIISLLVIPCIIYIITILMRRYERAMIKIAKTDTLTGLFNRRGFNDTLDEVLNETKELENYSTFIFDIDNFKNVNDTYGHLVGDKIIRVVGQLAQEILGNNGRLFRWGGDEYAGYLIGDVAQRELFLISLFEAITSHKELQNYHVTISLGITNVLKIDTIDTLLTRSDRALYQAKQNGKNQYFIF